MAVVTSDAAITVGLSSISSETPMSASSSQLEHASHMVQLEHVPRPSKERHAANEETGVREPRKHDERPDTPLDSVPVHEETHEVPVRRVLPWPPPPPL